MLVTRGEKNTNHLYDDELNTCFYSKLIRREIKRIHSDLDSARRASQAIENSIRDSREKLMNLEHKLNFKVGLELQLQEAKEQLQEHMNSYKVNTFQYFLLPYDKHLYDQGYEASVEPLKQQVREAQQKHEDAVKAWRVTEEAASKEERVMSRILERLEEYNHNISK